MLTERMRTDGIEVYTSKDLRKWKLHGLALHKDDVWADSRFWAPEIYEIDGKFYMYYTADEHICVKYSRFSVRSVQAEREETDGCWREDDR